MLGSQENGASRMHSQGTDGTPTFPDLDGWKSIGSVSRSMPGSRRNSIAVDSDPRRTSFAMSHSSLQGQSAMPDIMALLRARSTDVLGNVEMGPLLGRGAFGRVYKGSTPVSYLLSLTVFLSPRPRPSRPFTITSSLSQPFLMLHSSCLHLFWYLAVHICVTSQPRPSSLDLPSLPAPLHINV